MPSIRPSQMRQSVEGLSITFRLPHYTPEQYHELHFSGDPGVYVVTEALRVNPISRFNQRGLSQLASKIIHERITQHPTIQAIRESRKVYNVISLDLPLSRRKRCSDLLFGYACHYKPFVVATTNVWFADAEEKSGVFSLLADCGLPAYFVYPFFADALSEIGSLSTLATDLVEEYQQANICLTGYAAVLEQLLLDISKNKS